MKTPEPGRSSIVTTAHPLVGRSAATGAMVVKGENLTFTTSERVELVDLTERIRELARGSAVEHGTASVWSLHTTCALFINETQAALHTDIKRFLEEIVRRDAAWVHNDPAQSDCDRMNADSHLRAMLLGHSVTVQVSGGDLVLGQWQRILAAELDGPRDRSVRIQVMGIGR